MKRFVSLLLVMCLALSTAFAEENQPKSVWDSIGGWFNQAVEDAADWASQALSRILHLYFASLMSEP